MAEGGRRGGLTFLCCFLLRVGAAMACLWLYEVVAAPGGPVRGRSSRPIGFQRHPTPCVESSPPRPPSPRPGGFPRLRPTDLNLLPAQAQRRASTPALPCLFER